MPAPGGEICCRADSPSGLNCSDSARVARNRGVNATLCGPASLSFELSIPNGVITSGCVSARGPGVSIRGGKNALNVVSVWGGSVSVFDAGGSGRACSALARCSCEGPTGPAASPGACRFERLPLAPSLPRSRPPAHPPAHPSVVPRERGLQYAAHLAERAVGSGA